MLDSTRDIKAVLIISALFAPLITQATVYNGIDFPDGAASFADVVVDYDPAFAGNTGPLPAFQDATQALGIPDHPDADPEPDYVSLGDGGYIILRFTDNSLTGSDSNALDLWIFEIGPDVEDTFIDISKNGIDWFSVGEVGGSTSGIDIDAFGWGTSDFFSYVRLTDDPNEGQQGSGGTIGADIDAVGAISSAPPIPIPAAVWLFGSGLLGLIGIARRMKS
jgi:hypothetical protein